MAITKHIIFTIPIKNGKDISFDAIVSDKINLFLTEVNVVYVNHSISILNESVFEYNRINDYKYYIILSLVYKDLKESELDLTKASKKVKQVVKKSIEMGEALPMPEIETSFEKKNKSGAPK